MKTILLSAAMIAAISTGKAQTSWTIDNSHSKVGFSVTHMMVTETEGKFKLYEGSVSSKSDLDFTDAKVDFTIDVKSINTDDDQRDAHLKSPDFFDAEKFPKITFKATSMKQGKVRTNYDIEGELTIKGVTKKVKLLAIGAGKTVKDPWGNVKYGFKVVGTINRKDFGLTWNKALEAGGVLVSDEVNLNIIIELKKN